VNQFTGSPVNQITSEPINSFAPSRHVLAGSCAFPFPAFTDISIRMKAVLYNPSPAGWLASGVLRRYWRACLTSRLNGFSLEEMPPPELPGEPWVRLRTLLGGICGSDVALAVRSQPVNSILGAFNSMPFVLGHENVAVVEDLGPAVDPAWRGRRVCVEPTLGCVARGIAPPCPRCAAGEFGACENFADSSRGRYKLPPGKSIGYNGRTGGSLGERFVAHVSQLVPVPEAMSDEEAVLTDPLACSLHAVLRADLAGAANVLVYGAGVMGLGVIAALRATGFAGNIDAVDRAPYLKDHAMRLGASEFLILPEGPRDRFVEIANRTGGQAREARLGNWMLCGGYDAVFECVGSATSLTEALKWTRPRGQVMLVGTGHGRGVDLTPIWFQELTVRGAYGRQIENFAGRRIGTYQLVHEFMSAGKLPVRPLLTHTYRLDQFRQALDTSIHKGRHEAIKVAIDFR
jgi:L-iditol 2-dehydrogenase